MCWLWCLWLWWFWLLRFWLLRLWLLRLWRQGGLWSILEPAVTALGAAHDTPVDADRTVRDHIACTAGWAGKDHRIISLNILHRHGTRAMRAIGLR